jgi:glycosyltransferase involved in cell wall biosynthesis
VLLSILRRATRFAALNDEIADELVDLGVARDRVELVDNGVDLKLFAPPSAAERDAARARFGLGGAPVALFIGQLQDRKGILETLVAWRAVRRVIPDALLLVAGAGAREREVRSAAADPSRGVRYLSVLDDVATVLRAADVFVMPSRNESFGNATVEAMACGLPVVVCRVGVARRVRIDGVAGEVLDAPEPEAIARSLVDLLAAPLRARELGERAVTIAAEFAYDRVAERYLAIYESMLAARAT